VKELEFVCTQLKSGNFLKLVGKFFPPESFPTEFHAKQRKNGNTSRVTRWLCGEVAQNVTKNIFCQNEIVTFSVKRAQMFGYLSNFYECAQNKHSPNLGPML
jgi:hypothetical protein